jgi:transcriptional regulator with XRE-family HTH domain
MESLISLENIAKNFKSMRERRNSDGELLTQQDIEEESKKWVAEEGGVFIEPVSRARVSQWERGMFNDMSVGRLTSFCTVMDIEPEDLGIVFNRRRKNRRPGGQTIFIGENVPAYVVETIRDLLSKADYGYEIDTAGKKAIRNTLAKQLEKPGQSR